MSEWLYLQEWFVSMCDGEWEDTYGIKIETLDNPGWSLFIDLANTPLEKKAFNSLKIERSERDWIICSVADGKFSAYGGPRNLIEMIRTFIAWACGKKGDATRS